MPNLPKFASWLINLVLYPFNWLFQKVSDWIVSAINQIPFPDWWYQAQSFWSGLPSDVLYLVSWFNLGWGLTIMFSAYGIRFLIRRIPFFG